MGGVRPGLTLKALFIQSNKETEGGNGNGGGGGGGQLTARVSGGSATGSSIARSSRVSNVNNNEISQSQEAELKKHTEQSPASGHHRDAGRANARAGSGRITDRKYIISLCRSNPSLVLSFSAGKLGCGGRRLFSRVAPGTVEDKRATVPGNSPGRRVFLSAARVCVCVSQTVFSALGPGLFPGAAETRRQWR